MKVLIVEDEKRAANHLRRLLLKVAPQAQIQTQLESVAETVAWLQAKGASLDLIFADIQLADGLSFEIFAQCQVTCPIIFTTAYDQYAIQAFQTNGIDYLLKPLSEDRLRQALDKLQRLKPAFPLEAILAMNAPAKANYKSRFMIRVGSEIKSIPTADIAAFYSSEKATYALLHNQRKYLLDAALDQLESQLDPQHFFRISRKYILAHAGIAHIYAHSNSRLKVAVLGLEKFEVLVSRDRVAAFKAWLDS